MKRSSGGKMKLSTKITFAILLCLSVQSYANNEERHRLISDLTHYLPVALNASTVKCSAQGYSVRELKILIPELAQVTAMDHRNEGEGAPCVTSSACTATHQPEVLLQHGERTVIAPFNVKLTQTAYLDHTANTCVVYLIEDVDGLVEGIRFVHQRYVLVGQRHIDDCRKL